MYFILNSIEFFVIFPQFIIFLYLKLGVISEVLGFLFGGDVGQYSLSAFIRYCLRAAVSQQFFPAAWVKKTFPG